MRVPVKESGILTNPEFWSHYFIVILFFTKSTILHLLNYLIHQTMLERFLMISKKWNPPKSNLRGKNDGVVQLRREDGADRRNQYCGWLQHPGTSMGHQEDCLDHMSCHVCEKPCIPITPCTIGACHVFSAWSKHCNRSKSCPCFICLEVSLLNICVKQCKRNIGWVINRWYWNGIFLSPRNSPIFLMASLASLLSLLL